MTEKDRLDQVESLLAEMLPKVDRAIEDIANLNTRMVRLENKTDRLISTQAQMVNILHRHTEDIELLMQGFGKLEARQSKLEAGQAKLEAGQAKLEAGQAKLEAGQGKLEAGQAKLEAGQARLEAGQAKLETGQGKLETGQGKLEAGQGKLEAGQGKLEAGQEEVKTSIQLILQKLDAR